MKYSMNASLATFDLYGDQKLLAIAREISMDIHPIPDIIKRHGLSKEQFENILLHPGFIKLLEDATVTWQEALNTGERIKVKSLAMMEEWLPTAYQMLHEKSHTLRDKVELAKLVARFGGMGEKGAADTGTGERVTITINMGNEKREIDANLTIDHQTQVA